jgi:hypothetical protein
LYQIKTRYLIEWLYNPKKSVSLLDLLRNDKKGEKGCGPFSKYRNKCKRFGLCLNLICALINFDKGFSLK